MTSALSRTVSVRLTLSQSLTADDSPSRSASLSPVVTVKTWSQSFSGTGPLLSATKPLKITKTPSETLSFGSLSDDETLTLDSGSQSLSGSPSLAMTRTMTPTLGTLTITETRL